LKRIFPTRNIIYKTLRETQKGDIRESLDINVFENGQEQNLSRYSGGASDIMNLCVNLGLSKLARNRSNSKIEFIVLDEVLRYLDDENASKTLDLMKIISEEFKQVFVCTHKPIIKEMLPCLEVYRNSQGNSEVRFLS
jgi:DNA repair exonuclease SbcCD ATPase subunit